jgi:hypothetical protein
MRCESVNFQRRLCEDCEPMRSKNTTMKPLSKICASAASIASGCAILFVVAVAVENYLNRPSAAATAFRGDALYFGVLTALAAGYVTALVARHHHVRHSSILAGLASLCFLIPAWSSATDLLAGFFAGSLPTKLQWLHIVASYIVPGLVISGMVCLGGVLRTWSQGTRTIALKHSFR